MGWVTRPEGTGQELSTREAQTVPHLQHAGLLVQMVFRSHQEGARRYAEGCILHGLQGSNGRPGCVREPDWCAVVYYWLDVVVVLCHGQSDRISWRAAAQEGGVGGKVAGGRRMAGWLRMRPLQLDVPTSPRWSGGWGKRDN